MSKWIGNKYGRLLVIGDIKNSKGMCKCDCGTIKLVNLYDARRGRINSCGCLKREMRIKENTTHGLKNYRLYGIWANMKTRCYNENSPQYEYYGGRGILINRKWYDDF